MTQSEQNLPQSEQPQLEENQQSQNEVEPTTEEKLLVHEHYLGNLIRQHQISSSAVNRLEVICFSLVKFIFESTDLDYKKLSGLMEDLSATENLFDFWDVPEDLRPIEPAAMDAGEAAQGEEKAEEALSSQEG